MTDLVAPPDGYTYSRKEDREANAAKLNACDFHLFIPAEDSVDADSAQDYVCERCGGQVPTLLVQWYIYAFDHATELFR
jgi:hypothetical protein